MVIGGLERLAVVGLLGFGLAAGIGLQRFLPQGSTCNVNNRHRLNPTFGVLADGTERASF